MSVTCSSCKAEGGPCPEARSREMVWQLQCLEFQGWSQGWARGNWRCPVCTQDGCRRIVTPERPPGCCRCCHPDPAVYSGWQHITSAEERSQIRSEMQSPPLASQPSAYAQHGPALPRATFGFEHRANADQLPNTCIPSHSSSSESAAPPSVRPQQCSGLPSPPPQFVWENHSNGSRMEEVFTPEYLDAMGVHGSMVRKHGLVYLDWLPIAMSAAGLHDVAEFVRYATNDVSCSSSADTCMQPSTSTPAESSDSIASVHGKHSPDDPWAGLV